MSIEQSDIQECHVRTFLSNEKVEDLFRSGMTQEEAESAVNRDPRVQERTTHSTT